MELDAWKLIAIKGIIGSAATRLWLAEWPKWQKSSGNFSLSWVLWVLWVGTCEESEPVVSLWCDSWEGTVTKLANGLLFFLPSPYLVAVTTLLYTTLLYLVAVITLHYTTLHYFGAVFHYFTLLYSTLGRSFHYFTLLYTIGDIVLYFTLHMCALWWQVVISFSRLLCGIQPLWLCGPYHDLLCVWELLSCHSLSVRTVVTPFSILWEFSMACAVRTLCFSFMLTEQLYVCPTLHYPILYFWAAALLYSICALLYTTLFLPAAILYLYANVAIALYVYSLYSIYIMWSVGFAILTLSLHPEYYV